MQPTQNVWVATLSVPAQLPGMTGDTMTTVGQRVRYWRLRRGLDKRQFGDRVGRSVSWVEKIEGGERSLDRIPVLEKVAGVLGVTVQALTNPLAAERAARLPDAAEVAAITGALERYEVILGAPAGISEDPQPAALAPRVRYLDEAFLASGFSRIARELPRLLLETQIVHREQPGDVSSRLLVKTYRVASSTLLKLGAAETAWLAADRAMGVAVSSGDPYCLGRATRSVARAMSNLGRLESSLDALLAVIARMEPTIDTAADEIAALYGMVVLAAEISAAKLGDASTAGSMHGEALALAERRFTDGRIDPETAFGVTNVHLHRVSSMVYLGRPADALDAAAHIDMPALQALPRERRATFWLDAAAAHHQLGHGEATARALLTADRIAPEEARCRPESKRMIGSLIDDPNYRSGVELRALAQHAGVQT